MEITQVQVVIVEYIAAGNDFKLLKAFISGVVGGD